MTEGRHRDAWERTRSVAAITIQPHVKKRITPRQLLPMPWDNPKKAGRAPQSVKLSADEQRRRFEQLTSRLEGS